MVDVTEAMESDFVNADLVKNSPTKKCVILDEGVYEDAEYKGKKYKKFNITVEIDGKKKTWSPTRDSIKNISSVHGLNSRNWIGQVIILRVIASNGKETIMGLSLLEQPKQ